MIKMPKENMSKVFFNLEVGQGFFFFNNDSIWLQSKTRLTNSIAHTCANTDTHTHTPPYPYQYGNNNNKHIKHYE